MAVQNRNNRRAFGCGGVVHTPSPRSGLFGVDSACVVRGGMFVSHSDIFDYKEMRDGDGINQ